MLDAVHPPSQVMLDVHPSTFLSFPPSSQVMLDAVHPPSFPSLPSQVMLDAVHPPSFLPFPLKSCLMLSIHLPFHSLPSSHA